MIGPVKTIGMIGPVKAIVNRSLFIFNALHKKVGIKLLIIEIR